MAPPSTPEATAARAGVPPAEEKPDFLPIEEATLEQRATYDRVIHLVMKVKGLIESDWVSGTREEKYEKAATALAAIEEADRIVEECGFIDLKFNGRDDAIVSMKKWLRWTQPLLTASREDCVLVAILDTETTGLAEHDEPITVGAMLIEVTASKGEFLRIVDSYHGMREPSIAIHPKAQAVHGISAGELTGKSFDLMALQKITDSAALLIAHNAKFDRRMLAHVFPEIVNRQWACSIHSLKFEWAKITGGAQSLDAICEALEIVRPSPHNAINDCIALLEVLKVRAGKTSRSATLMGRLISNPWAPPI